MDEVVPGVWIGDLQSALDAKGLKERNIFSIVTAMRGKVTIHATFNKYQINVDDSANEDVLVHFLPSISFIQNELDKGRGVLVHCGAGISRSATIIAAYLMYSLKLDPDSAIDMIRTVRPIVEPNEGFMEQLKVFHRASYKFTPRDKATRMFYLERTMEDIMNGDGTIPENAMFAKHPRTPSDSVPNTPMIVPSRRIRCKMCRQELATREHMLDHGQLGPPTPALPSLSPATSRESSPEADIVIEDQHTQSPLRKRARRTSISIDITASESSQSLVMASEESKEPVRDDTYYMADGSCVLRVQNTLFKVHRTILSKDQSFFGPMFTLPQGGFGEEGMSDDHPIVLQGDTAEEFRHFLWALYALPSELIIVRSPKADLSRLIDIAKVSSKYSFKSTETWALDAIQEYLERNTSPLFNDNPLIRMFPTLNTRSSALLESEGQIARLIRLAQMCSHSRLMDTMIQLLQKLMSGSLHYSYLAMTLADEFNLRDLRGAAYLGVMQTSVFVCPGVGIGHTYVEGDIQETSEGPQRLVVSPVQQLRLLSGYHRLSKAWDKLRAVPPQFEHAPSCGATWHQHGCTQSWTDFWKEKTRSEGVLSLGSANVLGRLGIIIKEFDKWGSATYMHHDCKSAARRSIHEKVKQIQQALPEYFTEGGEY